MTCEEYKKCFGSFSDQFTRAERAALIAHVQECPACEHETMERVKEEFIKNGLSWALKQVRMANVAGDKDLDDPEFREVVGL